MSRRARTATLLLFTAVAGVAGWQGWKWAHRPWHPRNPLLTEPSLAGRQIRGPFVFTNGPGLAWLAREKPALSPPRELFPRMVQATQDPQLFRAVDRERRVDEVWLAGEPSSYRPLLDHLLETKDFTLSSIDHTSLIFRRGGEPWSERELERVTGQFADRRERACAEALAATKLVAVRQGEAALKLLKTAEQAGPDVPHVWAGWSTYRMSKGLWSDGLDAAEKALALDPDFTPAIASRAQCYYATKRFATAWNDAVRLLAAQPDDPSILFYHAKLAHEARAFTAETASLRKLIGLAEKAGANVSGYRVYLAQAYAAQNDADNAMDQVTLALLDTSLPREQRQFADELLQQIKRALPPP